jgi:putative membrane protein insertion efficiency factor
MKLALTMVRMYQRWISPMFLPACRFQPTCSEYAAEAIARHGLFFGTALTMWRLVRCNPLAKGGLDLVPTHIRCSHPALIPGQHD